MISYEFCQSKRNAFVKETESERLHSLFKQMFKNSHDGMLITDSENILMHNKTFLHIFQEAMARIQGGQHDSFTERRNNYQEPSSNQLLID